MGACSVDIFAGGVNNNFIMLRFVNAETFLDIDVMNWLLSLFTASDAHKY